MWCAYAMWNARMRYLSNGAFSNIETLTHVIEIITTVFFMNHQLFRLSHFSSMTSPELSSIGAMLKWSAMRFILWCYIHCMKSSKRCAHHFRLLHVLVILVDIRIGNVKCDEMVNRSYSHKAIAFGTVMPVHCCDGWIFHEYHIPCFVAALSQNKNLGTSCTCFGRYKIICALLKTKIKGPWTTGSILKDIHLDF